MSEQTVQRQDDMPSTIALTRRVLNRAFWRYVFAFEISWNYERMQALGFCWAMIPVLRHLNPDNNKFAAAMQRHLVFFNTSKVVGGPLILGTTIAMEEAGSTVSADGVKVAMMGPMAGIGDTITFALYNSIIFSLGANWAIEGHLYGPIFTAVMVLIPYLAVRRWQFNLGYKEGRNLVTRLSSGSLAKLTEGATVLGMIVLGGFIPYIVKIVTKLTYNHGQPLQAQLDAVLPFLLPVALTAFVYFLLKKFNLNPIWAIVVVFAIGVVLGGLGWFGVPPKGH